MPKKAVKKAAPKTPPKSLQPLKPIWHEYTHQEKRILMIVDKRYEHRWTNDRPSLMRAGWEPILIVGGIIGQIRGRRSMEPMSAGACATAAI